MEGGKGGDRGGERMRWREGKGWRGGERENGREGEERRRDRIREKMNEWRMEKLRPPSKSEHPPRLFPSHVLQVLRRVF